jgi:hypothetical protein
LRELGLTVTHGVLPLMEQFDFVTAAELDADAVAERLLAEVDAASGRYLTRHDPHGPLVVPKDEVEPRTRHGFTLCT